MVSPSSRRALMSKKSTSSFLERTRLTASPKEQAGTPSLVNRSSGSLVRFPARITLLKLTIFVLLFSQPYCANFTETSSVLKHLNFSNREQEDNRFQRENPHPPSPERASTPNAAMMVPETLLTHCKPPVESFERKRPVPPLKISHQAAEPRKTPTTSSAAERALSAPATPRPANIAASERIVVGFVSVIKNVEA